MVVVREGALPAGIIASSYCLEWPATVGVSLYVFVNSKPFTGLWKVCSPPTHPQWPRNKGFLLRLDGSSNDMKRRLFSNVLLVLSLRLLEDIRCGAGESHGSDKTRPPCWAPCLPACSPLVIVQRPRDLKRETGKRKAINESKIEKRNRKWEIKRN